MKSSFFSKIPLALLMLSTFLCLSCYEKTISSDEQAVKSLHQDFNKYWYEGKAEITSYVLDQSRYGEVHKGGEAALIFVTEDFHDAKQVKADRKDKSNHPVLKLNATKKFVTGVYPYALMSSTFYPISNDQHAIKTSFSSQEWCGNVYMQLNNRDKYELQMHSYFESEADYELALTKNLLENEVWTQLRIDPNSLTTGKTKMIPSLEFLSLRHQEVKAYDVMLSLKEEKGLMVYRMYYPALDRTLSIHFQKSFPYMIESWEEKIASRFGNAANQTSKAKRIKTSKLDYWNKNQKSDRDLRIGMGFSK